MKLGLALGGGGAKGAYQIGVLKALMEYNLLKKLKVVAGTSIGAFNSCLVMEKLSFEDMEKIWLKIDNHEMYNNGLNRLKKDKLGLFDQTKMYNILITSQDKKVLNKSKIKGFVVACEVDRPSLLSQITVNHLKEKVFYLNKLEEPHKAVLASSSVPIIFGPTEIDGKYYVDGGLLNNLPIDKVIEQNCNVVIVISLSPTNDLSIYHKNNLIIDFSPREKITKTFFGALNFNEELMIDRINSGYNEAKRLIEKLIELKVIKKGNFNLNKKGIYNYETLDEC